MNNFNQIHIVQIVWIVAQAILFSVCQVIQPEPVTNWGKWGDWDNCTSPNLHVVGFQVKAEKWLGVLDDSAMNGVKLYCGDPAYENRIASSVGSFGSWRNLYRCGPGDYLTGFQLKVEKGGSIDFDETATNNIRFYCGWNTTSYVEADGETWGKWGQAVHCTLGNAVCGLRTQVQRDMGVLLDDTALNNVQMNCCAVELLKATLQ